MTNLRKYALLLLIPALVSVLLVACGGGDDDDDGGSNLGDQVSGQGNDSNNNDDKTSDSDNKDDNKSDDNGGDIKASGDTGSDKDYVSAICKASRDYFDEIAQAFSKVDEDDPDSFVDAFVEPTEQFAKDFAKAKPPKDLKDWHAQAVDSLNQTVQALKSGDENAFDETSPEFPEMPADAAARLEKIAQDNDDCKALEESGGDLFGTP
ncbi:MAG: hypothetical protein ACM3S1_13305 [Hyphomicrobiales bacterium]